MTINVMTINEMLIIFFDLFFFNFKIAVSSACI
uniref:Uncharacterized protein n=1 Tax=viral metagenome TaxID=1070528 RepID=A0A6C0LSJ1_9ZZZZ